MAAVMDKSGNLYVSDTGNGEIRKITNYAQQRSNQIITRIAGNTAGLPTMDGIAGTSAYLNKPTDIDVDLSGNVYIINTNNNNVKMISVVDGTISTVAGQVSGTTGSTGDGMAATIAFLSNAYGLFVDVSANIYIGDTFNNRIRFVNAVTGIITTVAGNGVIGSSGDGKSATSANLYNPRGICVDSSGSMYIADSANHRIRMVINGIMWTLAGTDNCSSSKSVLFLIPSFICGAFFHLISFLCIIYSFCSQDQVRLALVAMVADRRQHYSTHRGMLQ